MSEGGTSFYSFVSKSQLGYSRRVKEKVVKQLHKNQELLAEVEGVEDYSKDVLDAVNFALVVWLSWGGDQKSLLELFSVIDKDKEREHFIDVSTPKVKGKRELKNLQCSINFEARGRRSSPAKCQRGVGGLGLRMSFPSLLRCNRSLGSLGLLLGFCGF